MKPFPQTPSATRPLLAIAAILVLASCIGVFSLARQFPVDSDEVQSFLSAQSILQGNLLLSGWHLSVDNFYFDDTLPFVLLEGVLGRHASEILLFSVLLHGLILSAAIAASQRVAFAARARLLGLAVILLLLGAPPANMYLPMLLPGLHGTGLLLSLVSLLLLGRLSRAEGLRSGGLAAGVAVTACAASASDPFTLIFAFGPAFLVCVWDGLAGAHPARSAAMAGLVASAAAAGMATPHLITALGGFRMEPTVVFGFVPPEDLGRNAAGLAVGLLNEAGANIFGHDVRSWMTIGGAIRLGAWAVGSGVVLTGARRVWGSPDRMFDRLLMAGMGALAAACVTSRMFEAGLAATLSSDPGEAVRYVTPLLVFGAILAARAMPAFIAGLPTRRLRWAGGGAILGGAAAVMAGHAVTAATSFGAPSWMAQSGQAAIGRVLLAKGLTCGVGNYWDANLVTALSNGKLAVRAVAGGPDGPLTPFRWLADDAWYAPMAKPQFAIWRPRQEDWMHVTASTITRTYGTPLTVVGVGDYKIAIYDGTLPASTHQQPSSFATANCQAR